MSFRPYQKPVQPQPKPVVLYIGIPPILPIPVGPGKTPKIHYMERQMDDGHIVRMAVVDENASKTLMANGFKKSYPEPGELAKLETTPEFTKHVICCPSPIAPIVESMTLYSLATFLQPRVADVQQCQARIRQKKLQCCPTAEQYRAALSSKESMNPLLRPRAKPYTPRQRGRFPKMSQKSVLEKIMDDAEKNSVERIAQACFYPRQGRFPCQPPK